MKQYKLFKVYIPIIKETESNFNNHYPQQHILYFQELYNYKKYENVLF